MGEEEEGEDAPEEAMVGVELFVRELRELLDWRERFER